MDCVGKCCIKVGEYLLFNYVTYLVFYKRNADALGKQMKSLNALEVDKQRLVDAARMRGDIIKEAVDDWLNRVKIMQSKEMALKITLEDSKGCLQVCSARYRVGKDAKLMIDTVEKLLKEGRKTDVVSIPAPLPPSLESMPTQDFKIYDSTKLAMEQIMDAFTKHKNINMVGVYGTGGVGKTTLTKEVAKQLKNNGLFSQVVMVTVSQDPVLTKIQHEIAENLGLPLTQESLSVRARLLQDRLKKEKQILIVLDDLWKPLNLVEEIGIPYGNNCKVVLTTRELEVCNQMKTQVNIEVRNLSEEDSWALFKSVAGDHIENNIELRSVAEQIVKECGGLPLAIVVIGEALRDQIQPVWEDAASQLKNSGSSPPDIEGVHQKVFCSIKLSYEYLASAATKSCLLLCCMFPEDYSISVDDLLLYVVGEGVFQNTGNLREARNRLVTQMERLKRSCLLLDDSRKKEGHVRMHDIIRSVCIWIASEESHDIVIKSSGSSTNWPNRETLKQSKRLSFMRSEITKLPNRGAHCPQLMTLSLRDNWKLGEIPDQFFQRMTSLKTLVLENTYISSVPSSFACLTGLRVLRIIRSLSNPYLDVSLLKKLKKLEILHLEECAVKLPEEIGELTNLKWLSFSHTQKLRIVPNTLLKLSLMEELDLLDTCFHEEEEEGAVCLPEIAHLSALSLTTLNMRIPNVKCLCAMKIRVQWEKLTRFSIALGVNGVVSFNSDFDQCRTRVFISGYIPPHLNPERMIELLEFAKGLKLNRCFGLKYVISNLRGRGSNNLRVLDIAFDDDMEYILSTSSVNEAEGHQEVGNEGEITQAISSSSTQQLDPSSSSLLRPTPIFCNLRHLHLSHCTKLRYVLPMSLALQCLQQLQILEIFYCNVLENIIVIDIEGKKAMRKTVLFPRLNYLALVGLIELSMVVSEGAQLSRRHWPSLEALRVNQCSKLERLPMSRQTVTKLREFEISDEGWFNRLKWGVDEDKLLLSHLRERGVKVRII